VRIAAKSWLTAYFIFFFFIWGIFLPFWGVWLASKGLNPEQIGTLFSLGLLLRFVSNIGLLGRLKNCRTAIRLLCTLSFFIFSCTLSLVFFQGWYALAAFTLLLNFLLAPMIPLGDIIGTYLVKQLNINYGKIRLWGSISFIVGSAFVGWTINEFGHDSVLWIMILFSLFIYALSLIKLSPQIQEESRSPRHYRIKLTFLLKQPKVIYFLLVMGFIQGSHSAYYAFSALYWESMDISEFYIALLWGIGVLAEVILMRFNEKLFSRWTIKQMCLLALIAALVRWSVISQTTDLVILMFVQTLHAFTFALAHLAAIRFIAKQPTQLMVSYQTLYSSVALGLVMASFTYLSGWVYSPQNSDVFLWMSCLLLPVFIFLKKWRC